MPRRARTSLALLFLAVALVTTNSADAKNSARTRSATTVDCGLIVVSSRPKPFRVVVKATSCATAIAWVRHPHARPGWTCAASAFVCWQGQSYARSTAFTWAFPIEMTSRARTADGAARATASRFIERFGVGYPPREWLSACRFSPGPVSTFHCGVRTRSRQCSGSIDFYRPPRRTFEALATRLGLDISCAE